MCKDVLQHLVEQWAALSKPLVMLELGEKKKKILDKKHIFHAKYKFLTCSNI